MPRDSRLYMTFPIDFHRHPKIRGLSDAAFRAFVEANGESRIAETDGRIETADAEFLWKPDVLAELVASHPTRPVLLREPDAYVLRDYAEHQFTKADREELHEKRSKAGRASADARRTRVEQVLSKSEHPPTESESGLEITTYVQESSHVSSEETDEETRLNTLARNVLTEGYRIDPDKLIGHIAQRTARELSAVQAKNVASWLLDKGKDVKNPQGYVLGAITKSWAEVQQYIDSGI